MDVMPAAAPTAAFEDSPADSRPVLRQLGPWEVALATTTNLAVVFALSLALILIAGRG
jgi:hypothetical protein